MNVSSSPGFSNLPYIVACYLVGLQTGGSHKERTSGSGGEPWCDREGNTRGGVRGWGVQALSVPSGIREHGRVTLMVTGAIAPGSLVDLHGSMPSEGADEMCEIVEGEFESIDSGDDRADFP